MVQSVPKCFFSFCFSSCFPYVSLILSKLESPHLFISHKNVELHTVHQSAVARGVRFIDALLEIHIPLVLLMAEIRLTS